MESETQTSHLTRSDVELLELKNSDKRAQKHALFFEEYPSFAINASSVNFDSVLTSALIITMVIDAAGRNIQVEDSLVYVRIVRIFLRYKISSALIIATVVATVAINAASEIL